VIASGVSNDFRRRYYLLLYCCLLIIVCKSSSVTAEPHTINALKVAYLYNIAKFTRWPATTWNREDEPFQFCFYEESGLLDELPMLQKKMINGHPIRLLKTDNELDVQRCNALYIQTNKRRRYRYLLSLIDPQRVLVIADDSPFFEYGGLINLVKQGQRLRFQVNKQQLTKSQLILSSKLLKLAILIDN